MEKLNKSYNAKKEFPHNLVNCGAHEDQLEQYRKRLRDHSCRLFCDPKDAAVDLLQLDVGEQGEYETCDRGFEQFRGLIVASICESKCKR